MRKYLVAAAVLVAPISGGTSAAYAGPAILNGSFELSSYSSSTEVGPYAGFTQGITSWTSSASPGSQGGFNVYWFPSDVAAGYSAPNRFGDPNDKLPTLVTASPAGGNFVALDGDTDYNGYLYQTLTGLTVGSNVTVSFWWAGAQLLNRTGQTTDSLAVTLGSAPGVGETHTTDAVTVATHGFSGWVKASETFTATSTSEVLSFLSIGTPGGLPPVALLDGVSVNVPEPVSLTVLGSGLVGLLVARRRKRA